MRRWLTQPAESGDGAEPSAFGAWVTRTFGPWPGLENLEHEPLEVVSWSVSAAYFFHFASLYPDLPGLYGLRR